MIVRTYKKENLIATHGVSFKARDIREHNMVRMLLYTFEMKSRKNTFALEYLKNILSNKSYYR